MKLNSKTVIIGKTVILVPYKQIHVPKYHKWMENESLREATSSELLSLNEEFEMQQSWLNDEKKCTFIILNSDGPGDEIDRMIGDVNLFISSEGHLRVAECCIMIAAEQVRRQGRAFEALSMMLKYGCDYLDIDKYVAKISVENWASKTLFEKVGFELTNYNAVFNEFTLVKVVDNSWKEWLNEISEWDLREEM